MGASFAARTPEALAHAPDALQDAWCLALELLRRPLGKRASDDADAAAGMLGCAAVGGGVL